MKDEIISCILLVILCICLFFGLGFGLNLLFPETETYTMIYSLGDGSKMSGSFVLGGGLIREESVYFYFAKTRNGGYIKDWVPARDTVIFMDQNELPYLKTRSRLALKEYELHVPEGTIVQQYSVGVNV